MFTVKFWKDAAERAISTAVQTGLAAMPVSVALVQEVNWPAVGSAALLGGILALAKAIVASSVGNRQSASLVD